MKNKIGETWGYWMSAQKGQTKEHQLLHKYISNICFYYCPNISNISFYKLSKQLKKINCQPNIISNIRCYCCQNMSIVWFYFGQITEIFAFTFAYIFFVKLVKKFSSDQRGDMRKTIPWYFFIESMSYIQKHWLNSYWLF